MGNNILKMLSIVFCLIFFYCCKVFSVGMLGIGIFLLMERLSDVEFVFIIEGDNCMEK